MIDMREGILSQMFELALVIEELHDAYLSLLYQAMHTQPFSQQGVVARRDVMPKAHVLMVFSNIGPADHHKTSVGPVGE